MLTKNKKKKRKNPLAFWLILQSLIIVVTSVMVSELVLVFANLILPTEEFYDPIIGIGMFFPMAIVTGLVFYFFSKKMNENTSKLMDAIKEVSSGNYHYKVETKRSLFQPIFQDFNKMTDELASIELLRNEFVNKFSHEFKTPIASISGFADLILRGNLSPEEQRQYLEIIVAESKRLVTLSTDSLLLSSLESQQIIPDKVHYSLDEQLRQVAILLSPQWNKKNIQVDLLLPDIHYLGNADLMQHVWINLFTNAIKYTPKGGTITISAKRENGQVIVEFHDSGTGMSSEEIANIFNKYYQGNPNDNGQGLGLGLAIVSRIVSLSKGQITVQSEKDCGSTFTIYLPHTSAKK